MGTFDDILLKAKELAKAAGSKTEEVMELTRLKMQAAQLRADMDANYMKLGEIIYELSKAGTENPELVNMCIAELEAQSDELNQLYSKINEVRNVVQCPGCGAANPTGSLFCARCGCSLVPKEAAPVEEPEEADEAPAELEEAAEAPVDVKGNDETAEED